MGNSAGKTNLGIVSLIAGLLGIGCIAMVITILWRRGKSKTAMQFLVWVELEYVIDTITALDQASRGLVPRFKTLIEKAGAKWGTEKGQIKDIDQLFLQCKSDLETTPTG